MRTQEEAKHSQSTSASEDSEPKPVRKITDVVSDEARETRAKIEDEVGEVKEAIRLLTSAHSKFDLSTSEALSGIRSDVGEVKEAFSDGFDMFQNVWDVERLRDIQRTVRETSSEVSASRRALNDLSLAQTERHDDLMAGISRAALQVGEKVSRAQGNIAEALVGIDRMRSEGVERAEALRKLDEHIGRASEAVVERVEGAVETERAMFDALRARFDLVIYACAGSLLAHVALLAVWGRS